jgi:hypothetical protein
MRGRAPHLDSRLAVAKKAYALLVKAAKSDLNISRGERPMIAAIYARKSTEQTGVSEEMKSTSETS